MPRTRCYLLARIMRGMRQRAGALLLVVLLLVPVAASAHRHGGLDTRRSCAMCVAAHHSPAIVAPAIGAPASAPAAVASAPPPWIAPASQHRSPRAGRAPPSPAPVSVA